LAASPIFSYRIPSSIAIVYESRLKQVIAGKVEEFIYTKGYKLRIKR
jgi:hypothetical protein